MRTNRHALVGIPLLQLPSPLSFDLLMIVERNRRWFSTHAHRSPNFFYLVLSQAATRFASLGDLSDATDIGLYMQFPFPARASLVWEGPGAGVGDEAPQDTHSTSPNPRCALLEDHAAGPFQASSRVHRLDATIFKYYTAKRQVQKFFNSPGGAGAACSWRGAPGWPGTGDERRQGRRLVSFFFFFPFCRDWPSLFRPSCRSSPPFQLLDLRCRGSLLMSCPPAACPVCHVVRVV